jgi:hypothetical protein
LVDALNNWDEALHAHRATTDPVVRIVLAEAAVAPGPLHYLLEVEGFQILGSASDEDELTRILSQSIEPDVVVVDAAVPAATAMVAHEFAPDSEIIVIWPDGIVPPVAADQVFPELVFEELGPAVRRAAERNRLRRPVEDEPDELASIVRIEPEEPEEPNAAAARTAGRVLVGTVALIAAIIVTMGASFALQGFHASRHAAMTRTPSVATSAPARTVGTSPTGSTHASPHATEPANTGCDAGRRSGPNAHASTKAHDHAADCPTHAGGAGHGADHRHGGGGTGPDQGEGAHHGPGTDHGQGTGDGQGMGLGGGHGSSGQHSNAPSDHPTGPPETPRAGDHAGPKG